VMSESPAPRVAYMAFGCAGGKPSLDEDSVGDEDLTGGLKDVLMLRETFIQLKRRGLRVVDERSGYAYCSGALSVDPRALIHRWLAPGDIDIFVLVFTGHGQPGTGDWLINEFAVRAMDVFRMWEFARRHVHEDARLIIVSDSCHSGMWLEALQTLPDVPWKYCRNIAVQAACKSSEKSFELGEQGSVFLQLWCLLQLNPNQARQSANLRDKSGVPPRSPSDQCPCAHTRWGYSKDAANDAPIEVVPGLHIFGEEYFQLWGKASLRECHTELQASNKSMPAWRRSKSSDPAHHIQVLHDAWLPRAAEAPMLPGQMEKIKCRL